MAKKENSKLKIAVCGKGGSGKSTVVTLLADEARDKGLTVLVLDSDESNSGLFRMLGLERPPLPLMELVGGKSKLKEKMSGPNILLEAQISLQQIPAPHRVEKNGLMLVSIGKILQSLEGCACPMGVLSREFLEKLRLAKDEIVFVDMEAGIEHFGRGIDTSIDRVLLVADPSFESLKLAERIRELAEGIGKRLSAVLNKVSSENLASRLRTEFENRGIDVIGIIPDDCLVFEACLEGHAFERGVASQAAGKLLNTLLRMV